MVPAVPLSLLKTQPLTTVDVAMNCFPVITVGLRQHLLCEISALLLGGQYTKCGMLSHTHRQLSEKPGTLLFPLLRICLWIDCRIAD